MCAMPSATFFLTFLRTRCAAVLAGALCHDDFLFPSITCWLTSSARLRALRGPLRVRALVRVRWPRTGRPLR